MRRREFITLLGGTVTAWPLAVRAQQPSMPVVALINGAMANTVTSSRNAAAFSRGLSETGFVEGQNVRVEFHWRRGDRITGLFAALHIVSLWHTGARDLAALAALRHVSIQSSGPV
jgi:putative tryptophan/tyrosine transport system substrate-binding protein